MTGMRWIMRQILAAYLCRLIQTGQVIPNILITPATHTGGMVQIERCNTSPQARRLGGSPWPP